MTAAYIGKCPTCKRRAFMTVTLGGDSAALLPTMQVICHHRDDDIKPNKVTLRRDT